ncbi:MAG: hypothetical protein V2J26_05245 [Pacificimonas sp.]|jgi:hypothetical protein|nr:hypothetical protein [Pacificimonas sp.]
MTDKTPKETTGENRRTETARRNDDSHLTGGPDTPNHQGRAGGDLQTDVATQASRERVDDPDATEGVTKEDEQQYTGRVGGAG